MIEMKRLLNFLALCCFILAGGIAYAYVYDVDPIPVGREYLLEKEIFDRSNDNWACEFPDFQTWLDLNEMREARLHDWLAAIARDAGAQFADIWEPGAYDRYQAQSERSCSPEDYAFDRGP